MPEPGPTESKRRREKYSRLICLGCRNRRIRCELPRGVEIPNPGELRTVPTPCYRCKRLGIPCVIRQTVLGRPSTVANATTAAEAGAPGTSDAVSCVVVELPLRSMARTRPTESSIAARATSRSLSTDLPRSHDGVTHCNGGSLLIHKPQSVETVLLIRAIDTLRCEHVEEEWFRHLPVHVGHTRALDLSIKAIVAACAYGRGVPKLTSGDCHQALGLALNALQADIVQSNGTPNDDILASTALLAPFEGAMKKSGIPTRLHVEAMGTILAARPSDYPVTDLAREILDFYTCESSIMACIQGAPSPFERVARAYIANDRMGCNGSDRAQLRAFANELSVRIPRLVRLVRSLQLQSCPHDRLMLKDALRLLKSLHKLQDPPAEQRVLRTTSIHCSDNPDVPLLLCQSLRFASVRDFEALASYWQNRLSLHRLELRLLDICASSDVPGDITDEPGSYSRIGVGSRANEIFRLVKNIMMCSEYADTLPLRKHDHLIVHAMVTVWGVKRDMPMAFSDGQDGERGESLWDLLLRRTNIALESQADLTAQDMDQAADLLAGGPSEGTFAKIYGL